MRAQLLDYHVRRHSRWTRPDGDPLGHLGLSYACLAAIVFGGCLVLRLVDIPTAIFMVLAAVFWLAGAVVSVAGAFRLPGRRSAIAGAMLSLVTGIGLWGVLIEFARLLRGVFE